MPDERPLDLRRQTLATGRAELRTLASQAREVMKAEVEVSKAAAAAEKAGDTVRATQLRTQAQQLGTRIRDVSEKRADWGRKLGDVFGGVSDDPCDCGAATPLLMLPVQLETRFVRDAKKKITHLRVRIYPDAIHNDTLLRRLEDAETAAGQAWWASDQGDEAWQALVGQVGSRRAPWVAERTRAGAAPPVPEDDDGRVARLLPDRFVVHAFQGTNGVIKAVGAPIPDAVPLDLFAEAGQVVHVNDTPVTKNKNSKSSEVAWIADFAAAKAIGLAVEMPWPNWSTERIDRLIAVGVRGDSAVESARQLDRLLESHRFGAGLGFVAPGTPTNNTDAQRSPWEPGPAPKPAPAPAVANSNRARLAQALGIEGRAFAGADGADAQPDLDARACNAALWWATWGPLLEMIDVDVQLRKTENGQPKRAQFRLTDVQREHLRVFHKEVLRGRGPLPAIRVGAQPYGILPVGLTAADGWKASGTDALIVTGARRARGFWKSSADGMKPLGPGSSNEAIAKAFGTAPVSGQVRARQAGAFEDPKDLDTGGALTSDDALEKFLDLLMLEDFYNEGQVEHETVVTAHPTINDHHTTRFVWYDDLQLSGESKPVALPYAHDSDPQRLVQIAGGQVSGKAESVLQALAMLAMKRAKQQQTANPLTMFDTLGTIAGVTAAAPVRGRSAAAAVSRMRRQGSEALLAAADRARTPAVDKAVARDYQPAGSADALSYSDLAVAAKHGMAKTELGQLGAWGVLLAEGVSADVSEGLQRLAGAHLTTADRHILVGEALDLASHRYDAWATAIATKRARILRATATSGLHIGAFGWLEDLQASDPVEYGYIHAPGMAHAVTAGILRSGYLAHKKEGARGAFAIDLTSARVRVAMDLVEARRSGQSLGESLGYRIERGLHREKLDRFIRNLRRFAWKLGKTTGQPVFGMVGESLGSGSVMDGVKLVDLYRKGAAGIAEIKAAATAVPQDNPYLQGGWIGLQPSEEPLLVKVIKEASDALDAVADLLVAESVHQLAQGNMARAAAVCDAASTGASPLPFPDVIATPSRARTLDHRALLLAGPGPGWSGGLSPRALAAPELEAWAAARLGQPGKVRLATAANGQAVTLASAGLTAIDVVYLAGSRANLEALIRTRAKLPPVADLPFILDRPKSGWVAGEITFGELVAAADLLRASLEAAKPATAADFGAANRPAQRSFATATGLSRLNGAIGTLEARSAQLKGKEPSAGVLASLWEFGIGAPQGDLLEKDRKRVAFDLDARIKAAKTARGGSPDAADIVAAGQVLFGPGFWILAPMAPVAAPDPWAGKSAASPARLRRWLADIATVRPLLARYGDGVLLSEAAGASVSLSTVQLAEDDGGTMTTDFAGDRAPDGVGVLALVERSGTAGQPAAALVLDRFAEPLPDTGKRTTAVAFNAPAPGARPPQACLLAVAPDDKRWTTDRLLDTVKEAMALSRMRGVTYEKLSASGLATRLLPAIYTQSWSLQGSDPVADWSMAGGFLPLQFVKEG